MLTKFVGTLPNDVSEVLTEIILIENGSTDGTLEACHRARETFPHLVRVCTIPRGSYGEAIKKGMLESRGTHISILECDFLETNFVSASLALFKGNRAQFVVDPSGIRSR